MKVADAVALAGHEVHVCRYREARTLLRWLGQDTGGDLRGLRVLDVAGGDGYWAGQTRKRGARASKRFSGSFSSIFGEALDVWR